MAIGRKDWFVLDSETIYLTHGSYGACLKDAFDYRLQWQAKLESQPFKFFTEDLFIHLEKSRKSLGNYIQCHYDDIVFFPNPTTAMNAILRSLNFSSKDQILTTNHEYGAIEKTWKFLSNKFGFDYIKIPINIPFNDEQSFIDLFENSITPKTRVIFLSHITSPTGLIFPVSEICKMAKKHNILSIIDGAHVPGHIPMDISALDADIYVGACHKWMCTPKGVSFLYCRRDLQSLIEPLVVSWGWESEYPSHSQFLDYHQYQGTNDFSSFLTVPIVTGFLNKNKWEIIGSKCHNLIIEAKEMYHNYKNIEGGFCSDNDDLIGQMLTFKINGEHPLVKNAKNNSVEELQKHIYKMSRIQIPVIVWNNEVFLRMSIQAYNTREEVETLFLFLKDSNLI